MLVYTPHKTNATAWHIEAKNGDIMAKGIKNMTSNEFIQAFKDALISTSYRKAFMKGYSKASNSAVKQ